MILLLHIIIALGSVAYTSYLYFSPTRKHFYAAYGLVGLTLASGTYLVLSTHSSLLTSCITGLVYIGIVLGGITAAQRKLAGVKLKSDISNHS